ncbi:hypothetical protein H257_13190 [Aphanomyces astaci]|uniref:Tc1-like transposase DDE domain-containing protein n=1 Tax=Aphanomyces astaci TaxID=112090 RepID=W4FVK4_APHAT|nr:hypothetical protein H257_13190 [Aphanomyces astaci]ETV71527.1 hypothetical protein H257_13190 [Aphanomyces astaci]|eukprot:XP_009838960.1 hypothetical protein H257_13190 [Aphanomyces astaci]
MSADGIRSAPTTEEKKRVLAVYSDGANWQIIAKYDGIALSTARRIVKTGQIANKPRGGASQSRTKVTPEILAALERYLDTNCQFTLTAMQEFIALDFPGTQLSKQTINRHLLGMLYTVKQVCIEPSTCNSDENKVKRKEFAAALVEYQRNGDFIVYYDETNFNIYCHRSIVAKHNGIALSTVRRIVKSGQIANKPRGSARQSRTKVTPDILAPLERYLDTNYQFTLTAMQEFIALDFPGTQLSKQTINRHLLGMLYTVKQVCIEPSTCNSDENKVKRKEFAAALVEYQRNGDFIVYYDETNFNIYCHRSIVAKHNGIALSTVRRIVKSGQIANKPRGGARQSRTKVTPDILAPLERYLDTNYQFTLTAMQEFIALDFPGTQLSNQMISRYLLRMLYSAKEVRIEPSTCNSDENKAKRKEFAAALTNFNIYCLRWVGRSKQGTRATIVLPPSKDPNLQVQCALSAEVGLVCHRLERGSIKMDKNAQFVEEVYRAAKASEAYTTSVVGKKVVIVLDNAPAHSQTEQRVASHDDLCQACLFQGRSDNKEFFSELLRALVFESAYPSLWALSTKPYSDLYTHTPHAASMDHGEPLPLTPRGRTGMVLHRTRSQEDVYAQPIDIPVAQYPPEMAVRHLGQQVRQAVDAQGARID